MYTVSVIHAYNHKEQNSIKINIKNDSESAFSVFDVAISVIENENHVFNYVACNQSLLTTNENWNCKFSFICIILGNKIYRIGNGRLVISLLSNFELQYEYNTNIKCDYDTFYFDNRNMTCLYGAVYKQLDILNVFEIINKLPNKIKHIGNVHNLESLINNVTDIFPTISKDVIMNNYNNKTLTMYIITISIINYPFSIVEINNTIIYNSISTIENIIETTTPSTIQTTTPSTIQTTTETNNTKTFRDHVIIIVNIAKSEHNYIYLLYLCIALIIIYIILNSLYLYKHVYSHRVNLWYVVLEIKDRIKKPFVNACTNVNDSSLNINNYQKVPNTSIEIELQVINTSPRLNPQKYEFITFKPLK
jgi:hypothetical protein